MRKTGHYKRVGDVEYFVPFPLPPQDPPIEITGELLLLYGEASFALGHLNAMAAELPDPPRFIRAYVLKEALLSSAIEGIHTTMLDVFTQPLTGAQRNKETQLVVNYTKALETALAMITDQGLPVTSRVILGAHKALMSLCEENHCDPGNYRKQAVRVGTLVPPPPLDIPDLMSDLEVYINHYTEHPPLIKAGLVHVQFETIHPFLDGNGRIGRLLIVLMLIDNGLLSIPVLYPSYYFKKHHEEYYVALDRVRTHGDFEGWLTYYLKAIRDSSRDAYRRIKDIEKLEQKLHQLIQSDTLFTKMGSTAYQTLDILFQVPIISTNELSVRLGKSYNTAAKALSRCKALGFLVEENKQRERLYRFDPYIKLLEQEYRE